MGFGGPHAGYLAVHAKHARQLPGRLVGVSRRRRRRTGLPAGAADPRTAHPPRQGDQQHLHRAGAAGGDGRHVRQLPRRRRAGRDRAAGARPRARGGRRSAAAGVDVVHDAFFDTVLARVPGPGRGDRRAAKARGHQHLAGRRRSRVGRPATRPPPTSTSTPVLAAFGADRRRRADASTLGPGIATAYLGVPDPPGVHRATAPRPR